MSGRTILMSMSGCRAPQVPRFGDRGSTNPMRKARAGLTASPWQIISSLRLHNDLEVFLPIIRPGTSSSRRLSAGSCQQRPKRPVTPYPGRFCRETPLFIDDFTSANHPCNLMKKEFCAQSMGGGTPSMTRASRHRCDSTKPNHKGMEYLT